MPPSVPSVEERLDELQRQSEERRAGAARDRRPTAGGAEPAGDPALDGRRHPARAGQGRHRRSGVAQGGEGTREAYLAVRHRWRRPAPMKPVEVYVAAAGNAFMTDIAGWLVEAAALAGREARLVTDRLPADPDVTNLVVAPHEFFVLHGGSDAELNAAAAVSVPICTEQPGTPWFYLGLSFCRPAAARARHQRQRRRRAAAPRHRGRPAAARRRAVHGRRARRA